jgi:16S rRNA (cytidine1402-2'-O)-methyltransferase
MSSAVEHSVGRLAEQVGRLFVVGTPIGNLEDITYRAVRVLGEVPLILAEDTRQTRKLLTRYGLRTRLLSYHQHNKRARLDLALAELAAGDVALVSSAGMPSISDPGFELITAAVEQDIDVDVIPGPSAVTTAVVGAAIPAPGFYFVGFLPRQRAERRRRLEALAEVPGSLVVYESPHRLVSMLADVAHVLGDRRMVLGRELTKLHQEYARGTVATITELYQHTDPRGEYTAVIGPAEPEAVSDSLEAVREALKLLRASGTDRAHALTVLTERHGMSRNDAYRLWLESESRPNLGGQRDESQSGPTTGT